MIQGLHPGSPQLGKTQHSIGPMFRGHSNSVVIYFFRRRTVPGRRQRLRQHFRHANDEQHFAGGLGIGFDTYGQPHLLDSQFLGAASVVAHDLFPAGGSAKNHLLVSHLSVVALVILSVLVAL